MELSFDTSEGSLLAVDSHRTVPAPFLTKTFQLVDDSSTDEIVSWSEDGTTFVVWRPPEFAKDILPNYFKHNNFSSFVRQLNTYGFRKIVSDRWEFANEFFRKGHQELLCEIHRRKTGQQPTTTMQQQTLRSGSEDFFTWSQASSHSVHSPRGAFTTAVSICDENERLRRDNCLLMSELARLRRLNEDVLLFLQNQVRMPLQDLNCIKWLRYNSLPPLLPLTTRPRVEEIVDDNAPGKPFTAVKPPAVLSYGKDFKVTSATTTLSLLDNKNNTVDRSSSTATTPDCDDDSPRLFGVPLNGKKRPLSQDSSSPAKSPRSDVELHLGSDPCWLKVCKSVSEKVFI